MRGAIIDPMTKHINLVTGNPRKIEEATATLSQYDIAVEIINIDIDEIQHRDPLKITEAKVRAAYEKVGKPVVVNDSNWEVPALGGFPGGYMKDIAHWLTPEDFLALLRDKDDWQIIFSMTFGHNLQTFIFDQPGKFVAPPRGKSGASVNKIITMDGSNGLTISEVFDRRDQGLAVETDTLQQWHQFAQWYIMQ